MDSIRQYLLSVICVCVIVGIITRFLGDKKPLTGIIKLISGVLIIFTVIAPVIRVELKDFQDFYSGITDDARKVVQQGEIMTQQSTEAIIKDQLEAYILDKASSLNLDVDINLTFENATVPKPERITISGDASPYNKKVFQAFLEKEIGIPEEMQSWR